MKKPKRRRRSATGRAAVPSPDQMLASAIELHQKGQLPSAETLYRRVLADQPRNVNALHFLGVLLHSRGDSAEALRLIQRAIFFDPRYLAARINCGNVLKEMHSYPEAELQFRKAIELEPNSGPAYNNLGTVLKAQHRIESAIAAFEKATALNPRHAEAFQNLGNALKKTDRIEDALTAFRKAVEIDPHQSDAHLNLGRALYRFGRVEEAAVVYEKWLEIDPKNSIAEHMLAACRGNAVPDRCSDEFVRESFDAFADSFDEVLERLEYRAPGLVAEAVDRALPPPQSQFRVLDVGCGTGLCGERLKPYSSELTGIDLSSKMVDKAAKLGLYDLLEVAELTQFLLAHPGEFDLIVAADTLVYFGALTEVFLATSASLREEGVFIFTVEADSQSDSYQLQPHGRYSHCETFVRRELLGAGFEVLAVEHETLRMEAEEPVEGLVVSAKRTA